MESNMLTIPISSRDRHYDQWLEHAEAAFTSIYPADSTGPLRSHDGPEQLTLQLAADVARGLRQQQAQEETEPEEAVPLLRWEVESRNGSFRQFTLR